jgi:hypothetical protein
MNRASHATDLFRISGLLLAVIGVGVHQFVAPHFSTARPFISLGGVLVASSGLVVIAAGVRRRIARAELAASKNRSALLPSP